MTYNKNFISKILIRKIYKFFSSHILNSLYVDSPHDMPQRVFYRLRLHNIRKHRKYLNIKTWLTDVDRRSVWEMRFHGFHFPKGLLLLRESLQIFFLHNIYQLTCCKSTLIRAYTHIYISVVEYLCKCVPLLCGYNLMGTQNNFKCEYYVYLA